MQPEVESRASTALRAGRMCPGRRRYRNHRRPS